MKRFCAVGICVVVLLLAFVNAESPCAQCPICEKGTPSWWFKMRHCVAGVSAPLQKTEFTAAAAECLEHQLTQVFGQSHITKDVFDLVVYKMLHPTQPLVMHFAGDNGVGKTMVARMISLALSTRCGNTDCTSGNAMYTVSGTGYNGMDLPTARQIIVGNIVEHARKHPHGIILLDDVTAMDPELVNMMAPLLGRSTHFPEAPEIELEHLTVILTTDFGKEGRARGKSLDELLQYIVAEFKEVYSPTVASNIRTFPFLPVGTSTAESICENELKKLPCTHPHIVSVKYDGAVVRQIVKSVESKGQLVGENGRAITMAVRDINGALTQDILMKHGTDRRFTANFYWNPANGDIQLQALDQQGNELEHPEL